MGMMKKVSTCTCSSKPEFPNPDPKNFKIIQIETIGNHVVVVIKYPDCTNYEGKKVMLYTFTNESDIRKATTLDPHFCENCITSPFARFEPTKVGFNAACLLATKLQEKEK